MPTSMMENLQKILHLQNMQIHLHRLTHIVLQVLVFLVEILHQH